MRDDPNFGRVLGRLYGWNTLGAVAGVVIGETYLIGAYWRAWDSALAGVLNMIAAAVGSVALDEAADPGSPPPQDRHAPALRQQERRMACRRLSFGILSSCPGGRLVPLSLALRQRPFDGVCADAGHRPRRHCARRAGCRRLASSLARRTPLRFTGRFFGGRSVRDLLFGVPAGHRAFTDCPPLPDRSTSCKSACLSCFPSLSSQEFFFMLLGAALRSHLASETETAGVLTLANTTGAALGSLTGGFVLLPVLGMERSVFLIAAVYGGLGFLLAPRDGGPNGARRAAQDRLRNRSTCLVSLTFFPFGSMEKGLLPIPVSGGLCGSRQTSRGGPRRSDRDRHLLRAADPGKPVSYAMLTNSFSMSTTDYGCAVT